MYQNAVRFWQKRSLRFWLTSGLVMTISPFIAFSILTYLFVNERIVSPLLTLSSEQLGILSPVNALQKNAWDVSRAITNFTIDGDANYRAEYTAHAQQIDDAFSQLNQSPSVVYSRLNEDLLIAQQQWTKVASHSEVILGMPHNHDYSESGSRVIEFENEINKLGYELEQIYEDLQQHNEQLHHQVLKTIEQAERLYVLVLFLAVLLGLLGLVIINRSLLSSMDKLTEGASKFATGDTNHHIDIGIPVEMASVAHTFNSMKNKIIEQHKALELVANMDGLTGLLNRRKFDEQIDQEIKLAQQGHYPISIIILDIDHFKQFNDTYGHLGGDEALKTVAQTLAKNLGSNDKACRYGGEEFVVILPHCASSTALRIAEKLRQCVASQVIIIEERKVTTLTASSGVATFPEHGQTTQMLIKRADQALYKAKASGRNRVMMATINC
ncbi:sensor domain-containing diguanylate cyclase [Pseudoalteromonas sp. MMG022]|uniref:sensor domain-containing diguanylate cyclase n=1 Tax=Pseudoalteromonas sp. MMG022 TaxID=2909978 RepID=UPI001F199F10|nr:sensor domain-containing diguanylate cyclase [Pseudoalteromonas sp. MMG022]MCF6437711.1 sensor domain-containing diguanylate cyclase [Pseudoalteromonas sp. MMG022]